MKYKSIFLAAALGLIISLICFAETAAVTKIAMLSGSDYRSLAVRGNYAYCAIDGSGLKILDISDPTNPTVKGKYNTPGNSRSVKVIGDYAYVADKYSGIQIINISNPGSPTWVGSCHQSPGWAEDLDISGNYSYTSYDSGGFRVFNIANPASPFWVSSFSTAGQTEGVAVTGKYVFIPLESKGLEVLNVADPSAPYRAKWLRLSNSGEDIALVGNYAYYSDSNAGLMVLDISNPAEPVHKGTCNTPGNALGVATAGNYAYVADSGCGLQVINISNPSAPTVAGSYNDAYFYGSDLVVVGNYIYVTDGWYNQFLVFKVSFGSTVAVTVTSPNGGESWETGSSYSATWAQSGLSGDVTIDLYKGGKFETNIGTTAANTGSFQWKVPYDLAAGSDYKVKIYQGSKGDFSDNNFSITEGDPQPDIALNRTYLYFGSVGSACTQGQTVVVENAGSGTLNWTADSDQSWIQVTPASGTGDGTFQVCVNPAGLTVSTYYGIITVRADIFHYEWLIVQLEVYDSGTLPFGDFTTPADQSTVSGSIPVTGWVLDDVEVTGIKIYRDPVNGEGAGPVYIGDAVFVEGARPDIEQSFPLYPMNYRAGWGYMMLTNFLPNGGTGTFTLYAQATDREGNTTSLGQKTIICDNANAVKPFGSIDSPVAGGTASGKAYVNGGWVLTPLPNNIPTDGSTLEVYVDGVKVGQPEYNIYRSDVASLFPGNANSQGAGGRFTLDTTAYDNGVHSIHWTAVDSAGNSDGIGSRYFIIQNVNSSSASVSQTFEFPGTLPLSAANKAARVQVLESTPIDYFEPVDVTIGTDQTAQHERILPNAHGYIDIDAREMDRVKIDLDETRWRGFQLVGDQLRKLPPGSSFNSHKGRFYWQIGPGFVGEYFFVFIRTNWDGTSEKKYIKINVKEKYSE